MKKVRKNIKMIIGIVIGVIISVTTSYVLAATLINSKDVVYQDNMSIGATNVQNAIDGTCSKIDTRLSAIEDNLYTIEPIYKMENFTSSLDMAYTGVSITLPGNSYCAITAGALWTHGAPIKMLLGYSPTVQRQAAGFVGGNDDLDSGHISVSYNAHITSAQTLYVWSQYTDVGENSVEITGFCATKTK